MNQVNKQNQWIVTHRPDCTDWTWEVRKNGENYTVDVPVIGDPTCGCGQSKCEHIIAVLQAKYSPAHPILQEHKRKIGHETQECIVCELGIFTITAELYYSEISQVWQPRVHLMTNAEDRTLGPQTAADLGTCLIRAAERIHEMAQEKSMGG